MLERRALRAFAFGLANDQTLVMVYAYYQGAVSEQHRFCGLESMMAAVDGSRAAAFAFHDILYALVIFRWTSPPFKASSRFVWTACRGFLHSGSA